VVEEHAQVNGSIIWPNSRIGEHAVVENAILGRNCHVGRNCLVRGGAVLGDKTLLTDYTRT
jgi:NDP-sugar pyrophosphorylase family protein